MLTGSFKAAKKCAADSAGDPPTDNETDRVPRSEVTAPNSPEPSAVPNARGLADTTLLKELELVKAENVALKASPPDQELNRKIEQLEMDLTSQKDKTAALKEALAEVR